jgi:hypothetical protein
MTDEKETPVSQKLKQRGGVLTWSEEAKGPIIIIFIDVG